MPPSMMSQEEKIEFLAGQMHALVGFATALITSHPDPARLAAHLEKIEPINLAAAENTLVSDRYIEGVRDMQQRLTDSAGMVLAQRNSSETK